MRALRSFLFVPADKTRLLAGAERRGADMVILDLEDGVAPEKKYDARATLPDVIGSLSCLGVRVAVRLNEDWSEDLPAAMQPGLVALMLPKVEKPEALIDLDRAIGGAPAQKDLRVIALLESPAAMFDLARIASAPRLGALAFGSEDYALAMATPPGPELLEQPCRMIAMAASTAGLGAIGLPGSLGDFSDMEAFNAVTTRARAMGLTGALCIHPAQIAPVNAAFGPTERDRIWAADVLAAWEEAAASGASVCQLDGRMIDRPVIAPARAISALFQGVIQ